MQFSYEILPKWIDILVAQHSSRPLANILEMTDIKNDGVMFLDPLFFLDVSRKDGRRERGKLHLIVLALDRM